jgi:hypothetical protein
MRTDVQAAYDAGLAATWHATAVKDANQDTVFDPAFAALSAWPVAQRRPPAEAPAAAAPDRAVVRGIGRLPATALLDKADSRCANCWCTASGGWRTTSPPAGDPAL